ncbi:NLR family CARD domain-containing protein 3 [Merluccius polli]|uniref:NLR family CARD domain-containing protein 3 n=1 Tax=Merluccius polli TaxID=89951 RepID=A0AA47MHH8_MERPO|nr:NLR family CARD domain-containing protein 3 [Merluccius polli]
MLQPRRSRLPKTLTSGASSLTARPPAGSLSPRLPALQTPSPSQQTPSPRHHSQRSPAHSDSGARVQILRATSVYSGVFTQKFKKECGLYQDKVFCFVHLSIQEFLAALHVFLTFRNTGVNLLSEEQPTSGGDELLLYQSAVDKALLSENGHLDLFLRFLLGLSLETNQIPLQGLLGQTGSSSQTYQIILRDLRQTGNKSQTNQKTVSYIKEKIGGDISTERSINLFRCLNELKDRSLVEQIQQYLTSGSLSRAFLSPAQWSALVFILLTSEEELDVFDLKKYSASEKALLRLLPVFKDSKTYL